MEKYSRKKRKFNFRKFLTTYIIFLTILMVIALIYVIRSLVTYENLQVEKFLDKTMQDVANNGILKYIDISKISIGKYESKDIKIDEAIGELLKTSNFTYKLNSESTDLNNPIYDVYLNDNLIFNVELNGEKKITRLGILTFQDWKLEKLNLASTNGLFECNIEVPSNLKVYVNNIEVAESEKSEGEIDEGLKELATYTEIPYLIKYNITGLLKEPDVRIQDKNGVIKEYKKENSTYKISLEYKEIQDEKQALKEIKSNIDILKIAEDWSLYLSNDLDGKTHGFYNINKYLIKDSYMWNYAYKWATNIDITFISSHTLLNPTFTNTKVSNFKIYSDNAFSCEVYLDKNMKLKNGTKLTDTMNERIYFAYYDGAWKLVNMQSIKK